MKDLRANLWLLGLTLVICAVIYPAALLGIGQAIFPFQAQGSLVDKDGKPAKDERQAVGSLLIAQPFSADEYFQPRPSAVSYNAAASGASNWAANNPLLRDRVARRLGPIVKYRGGPKDGQLVGPDIEAWFGKDLFQGQPSIVAQWVNAHNGFAQSWVGAAFDAEHPTPPQQYVLDWAKSHADVVAQCIADNPDHPQPSPADLAVVFFNTFAKENPGKFLAIVTNTDAQGQSTATVEAVAAGSDIQSIFFDMWRQDHPDVSLEDVPADLVMASGSGLDPHITLENALYQLDRVAAKRAADAKLPEDQVREAIKQCLKQHAAAPLGGIAGVPCVNVLEVNLALPAVVERLAAAK